MALMNDTAMKRSRAVRRAQPRHGHQLPTRCCHYGIDGSFMAVCFVCFWRSSSVTWIRATAARRRGGAIKDVTTATSTIMENISDEMIPSRIPAIAMTISTTPREFKAEPTATASQCPSRHNLESRYTPRNLPTMATTSTLIAAKATEGFSKAVDGSA